jgi:hypothetical protein
MKASAHQPIVKLTASRRIPTRIGKFQLNRDQ